MSKSKYMKPRAVRRESRNPAGRFRGGKLSPVMAVPFRESESGILNQSAVLELDPVAGRMITPITAEVVAVYVPVPAMDALEYPDQDYPGNAEVIRQKLLSGAPLFPLEEESYISKRCGVAPVMVNGVPMVNSAVRLAHNCAVNYLRRKKYVYAAQVDASNVYQTPAILSQTVLDKLNAVLDPEDRVNGAVAFQIPQMELPVKGIGIVVPQTDSFPDTNVVAREADETYPTYAKANVGGAEWAMERRASTPFPNVRAMLSGTTSQISLTDFYTAEVQDALTREMRQIVDDNPEYGEELVARFAHGMSTDVGDQPFELYRKEVIFGQQIKPAMDGPSLGQTQSNHMVEFEYSVLVPPTEFGGVVITFLSVKPDETLGSQPHPVFADAWGARNYVADELAIDPVPVKARQVNSDVALADEDNVMFYIANNGLLKNYVNYGFTRNLDLNTVENKTALWQLQIPMSVTPETIVYPENLDHYPFVDNLAEICTYTFRSVARIDTPIIFGPTPVEELAAIETENVFNDQ